MALHRDGEGRAGATPSTRTPSCKKAGVVDAGGMGFCHDSRGHARRACSGNDVALRGRTQAQDERSRPTSPTLHTEDITFAFDTVYIVRKADEDHRPLDPLRVYLDTIGDSLVIGEDDEAFKVHVHTNIPGEAPDRVPEIRHAGAGEDREHAHAARRSGRRAQGPRRPTISRPSSRSSKQVTPQSPRPPRRKSPSALSPCARAKVLPVCSAISAPTSIIEGGQTMNPSTEDILHAIEQTPAEVVFVLPNNKNIIMAAQAAAGAGDARSRGCTHQNRSAGHHGDAELRRDAVRQ